MLQIIVKLMGVLLVLGGVVLIYDARMITKKFFGFGDQNDGAQRFKDIRIYYFNRWWINCIFCVNLLDK